MHALLSFVPLLKFSSQLLLPRAYLPAAARATTAAAAQRSFGPRRCETVIKSSLLPTSILSQCTLVLPRILNQKVSCPLNI